MISTSEARQQLTLAMCTYMRIGEAIVTTILCDGAPNSITSTSFRIFIVYNSFDCDLFRGGYFYRISVQIVGVVERSIADLAVRDLTRDDLG